MNLNHSDIIAMRKDGYSYGAIASITGLSINTIAAVCKRAGITIKDIGPSISKREMDISYCKYCHKPFSNPWHRKSKLFCSSTCHDKWWNEKKRKEKLMKKHFEEEMDEVAT